jgi:hypothetical protein
MRPSSYTFELAMIAVIVAMAALNGALYGGLLTSASGGSATLSASQRAELDDSSALPGRFVPSQGRQHTRAPYPNNERVAFCDADGISNGCYASNPPSSGTHLPVQQARLPDGGLLKLPPDPGVYASVIPREAIPHIEEHAGVYAGYNCAGNACQVAVDRMTDIVSQEISLGARVVMSPDPDLDEDTLALASWTRVDSFAAADYSDERTRAFIKAHSCRFDPERMCPPPAIN